MRRPTVSVLMPTYRHAWCLPRAIESLLKQECSDWELVVVDDGSPDETPAVLKKYLQDPRVRYVHHDENLGLGRRLNEATRLAIGRYIAYLPSDDIYLPDHLRSLSSVLERESDSYLAYAGVVCNDSWEGWTGWTLQGDEAAGAEREALQTGLRDSKAPALSSRNVLALVQTMHRRTLEKHVRWAERTEIVSDSLEPDYWRSLLDNGARLSCSWQVTCEWTNHPDQRHKIISQAWGRQPGALHGRAGRGLSGYRTYYRVNAGEQINWRPTDGIVIDERLQYGPLNNDGLSTSIQDRAPLRILLAGDLGYNPERVLALQEAGHVLAGTWISHPEAWDTSGPLPFGGIQSIEQGDDWAARVREFDPDVIYALLNFQALPLIERIVTECAEFPVAFHFKESPFLAMRLGLWPNLCNVLASSAGHIFINEESRHWFRANLPDETAGKSSLILDGDLPKNNWMRSLASVKLSSVTGEIHTVCAGRPVGLDDFADIARHGIHVHLYGEHNQARHTEWVAENLPSGYLHLHATVTPNRWAQELSQYDAAWLHVPQRHRGLGPEAVMWSDLNLPARIGTYAMAGLPWILPHSERPTAVQRLAAELGIAVNFRHYGELADRLRDTELLSAVTSRAVGARPYFTFDNHVPRLTRFFKDLIAQRASHGR